MSVTYGRTSPKQFAFFDRDTSCWRMWPDISLWGSEPYSQAWPNCGTTHDGRAFEHAMPVRLTDENECSSLLPTPAASDSELLPTPTANMNTGAGEQGREGGLNLQTAINLLPTPTAVDAKNGRNATLRRKPESRHHSGTTLSDWCEQTLLVTSSETPSDETKLLPTPSADESGGSVERYHERLAGKDPRHSTFVPLKMLMSTFESTEQLSLDGSD